jgi:DNA-binding Lrp family transcriptional regulator
VSARGNMRIRRFNEIDLRILMELQRDGRITIQHLSKVVGLTARPCLERVRRLEREGVIAGYTARVDVARLADTITFITQIRVEQGREIRTRFEQQLNSYPEVVECFEVSGAFNYIVKVVSPAINSYRELTEAWLKDTSMGVERIESHVVLSAAKDSQVYPVAIVEPSSRTGAQNWKLDDSSRPL